jgi:hypothetical protein
MKELRSIRMHLPPAHGQLLELSAQACRACWVRSRNLLRLIAARFTGMGYLMLVSFLTLHALKVTGRPEADEGRFVSLQNVGTILGSLLAAWLGYHSGGKVLLILSRLICVGLCVWVLPDAFVQRLHRGVFRARFRPVPRPCGRSDAHRRALPARAPLHATRPCWASAMCGRCCSPPAWAA